MFQNANKMHELQRRQVFYITDWCISIRVPRLAELLYLTAKKSADLVSIDH